MAIQFPSSPTDGQFYPTVNPEFVYNAAKTRWDSLPLEGAKTITSDVVPTGAQDGDQWFNTVTGVLYIWVVDTDGGQWVESVAPISANGYYSPNYIINGGFEINQRGLTSSGLTTPGYGFDRWINGISGGTVTQSAQTFAPGTLQTSIGDATNYYRTVISGQSATGDWAAFWQGIEDAHTLAGQTVTLSFWAKAATGTPKIAIEYSQMFGTGGSPSTAVNNPVSAVTISTTWNRYSITFTIPSVSGKTFGTSVNSSALYLNFWLSAGSSFAARTSNIGIQNNTFDVYGVQLEQGNAATPFRRNANSIQGELAACQRYFVSFNSSKGTSFFPYYASGSMYNTVSGTAYLPLPVEMRISPSVSTSSASSFQILTSGANVQVTSIGGGDSNALSLGILINSASTLATDAGFTLRGNGTASYILASAEL